MYQRSRILTCVLTLLSSAALGTAEWTMLPVEADGGGRSLVLDSTGRPTLTYYCEKARAMKYAAWNGSAWDIQTVVDGIYYPRACHVLDAEGRPRILYCHREVDNGAWDLRYATWDGSTWDIQTIFTAPYDVNHLGLALDPSGSPRVGFSREYVSEGFVYGQLMYGARNGTSWEFQLVDPAVTVCWGIAFALDNAGEPRVLYQTDEVLKYASWAGSAWDIQEVDTVGQAAYDGKSLVLDASGNPRICYPSTPPDKSSWDVDLKYASWNGTSWDIEVVDADDEAETYESSLAFGPDGRARISYLAFYPFYDEDLRYAVWNGSVWEIETIVAEGLAGDLTSLAIDDEGHSWISYHDRTNDMFMVATDAPEPASAIALGLAGAALLRRRPGRRRRTSRGAPRPWCGRSAGGSACP